MITISMYIFSMFEINLPENKIAGAVTVPAPPTLQSLHPGAVTDPAPRATAVPAPPTSTPVVYCSGNKSLIAQYIITGSQCVKC